MSESVLIIDGGIAYGNAKGELSHAFCALAQEELTRMGYSVTTTRIADGWDAQAENEKMRNASAVLLQIPIWWMAPPWQVKKYFDEVFGAGMITGDGRTRTNPDINYGTGGLLKSRYMLSCTWNAPKYAFTAPEEFFEGKGIDAVLFPVHKAFQFLGMTPMKTFMANDVMKNPKIDADMERFKILLSENFAR